MMLADIISAGLLALKGYIATHVLTCLVPAFFLAGAMVTFIRREAVLALLGEKSVSCVLFHWQAVPASSLLPAHAP